MKKTAIAVLVLGLLASAVFADYNGQVASRVMRDNVSALGKLRAAAGSGDHAAAGDSLMIIASGTLKLLAMDPPRGQKAEWDALIKDAVRAALKGVDAAMEKNKAGVDAAAVEIASAERKGHTTFR